MPPAADAPTARIGTRRGIEPNLEALRMGVVGKLLHRRETLVDGYRPVWIALRTLEGGVVLRRGLVLPIVVDVDVCPAVVRETRLVESVDRVADVLGGDRAGEAVPRVPPHRRSKRDLVAHDELERARVLALGVLRRELDHVCAGVLDGAAEDALLCVERRTWGKALRLKHKRSLARHGETPYYRMPGPHAEDARAVDAWRRRSWRREHAELRIVHLARNGALPVLHREERVGPVRMVEPVAIVGIEDEEPHRLCAREVGVNVDALAPPLQDAGGRDFATVRKHREPYARVVLPAGEYLGVNPHVGVERNRLSADVEQHIRRRMSPYAALECLRPYAKRLALNGLVLLRGPIPAGHAFYRKLVKPHASVCRRREGRQGHERSRNRGDANSDMCHLICLLEYIVAVA